MVGAIFKGKVQNLEPGLKAAFVDIGQEKNAFLHYWDMLPGQITIRPLKLFAKTRKNPLPSMRSKASRIFQRHFQLARK